MPSNNINYLLQLNIYALNEALRELSLQDNRCIDSLLNDLASSERYINDYKFTLVIDINRITYQVNNGQYDQYNAIIDHVYNRALACNDTFLLIEACSRLSRAYSEIERIDKAVDCYMIIIKLKNSNHHATGESAIAYHNIGVQYYTYGDLKNAIFYTKKAHNIMHALDRNSLLLKSFYVYNLSSLASHYFNAKQYSSGCYYYDMAQKNLEDNLSFKSHAAFYDVSMYYYAYLKNYNAVSKYYHQLIALLKQHKVSPAIVNVTNNFIKLSQQFDVPTSNLVLFAIDAIKTAQGKAQYKNSAPLYIMIIDYYISLGDDSLAASYLQTFTTMINTYDTRIIKQKSKLFEINRENERKKEQHIPASLKNKSLQSLYNENIKKNQYIEEMYDRIALISNIGQEITQSRSIVDIGKTMYKMLNHNMIIDSFYLLTIEDNSNIVTPVFTAYKDKDTPKNFPTLSIDIDIIKQLIILDEFIISNDLHNDNNLSYFMENMSTLLSDINSSIFLPIKFQSKAIGILALMAKEKNAYKSTYPEFISQLSIFLAIAVNNVEREIKLANYIKARKEKQQELITINRQLILLSQIDELTQVDNRRTFESKFKMIIQSAQRQKVFINVYMVDIDHFKPYNDTLGHQKGDETLKIVANLLSEAFSKPNELIARYGGEEFIAVNLTSSAETASTLAETLRQNIEALNITHLASNYNHITISIGVASIKSNRDIDKIKMIIEADSMLYVAKKNGRNCVEQTIIK